MTITLYGGEVSYFTGKVRAYLRWADLPFEEVIASADVYRQIILPSVGVPVIPVLRTQSGEILQDTTVIIDTLDQDRATSPPSVYPATPIRKLVALMLETYGDEWLVIPAMHYRWHYDREWAMGEFGALNAPRASAEEQYKIGSKLATPFSNAASLLGATPDMMAAVERAYEALLAELDAHFASSPALLGDQATMADFGLIGPLYAHLYRDPTPGKLMRGLAPNVTRWVEELQFQPRRLRQPLDDGDDIPATLLPVLRRMAREQLPPLVDAAGKVSAWMVEHPGEPLPRTLGKHGFELEGRHGERILRPYSLWMVQRIRDHLKGMEPAAREQADAFLRSIGADALIEFPDPPRLARDKLSVRPAGS
ncbi:glutathione S-transferase [Alcanivorax sp. 24]|uniref:glutathione S-transferase n=1 Tax=Alcanivorax sp. 24 TaxID=2545266 RepID=UPI00105F56C5|nr:glutathione S-transferase [Alcanivorax sp. 24]